MFCLELKLNIGTVWGTLTTGVFLCFRSPVQPMRSCTSKRKSICSLQWLTPDHFLFSAQSSWTRSWCNIQKHWKDQEMDTEWYVTDFWCYVTDNTAPWWAYIHCNPHSISTRRSWLFLYTKFCFLILLVCNTSALYVVVHTWRRTFVAYMSSRQDIYYTAMSWHKCISCLVFCLSSCVQLANKWACRWAHFVKGAVCKT